MRQKMDSNLVVLRYQDVFLGYLNSLLSIYLGDDNIRGGSAVMYRLWYDGRLLFLWIETLLEVYS